MPRLGQRAVAVQAIGPGVVRRGGADEQMGIAHLRKLPQNLRQGLLAQLGGSTRARGERSQFQDLLTRHGRHLLSQNASSQVAGSGPGAPATGTPAPEPKLS